MNFDNTYAIIDLDAIAHNFAAIQKKAQVPVMAIVKADAYGHGAVPVARLLQESCSFFGVSSFAEAIELRQAGIQKPILILGYLSPQAFPQAIRAGIRPTIYHYEDALALSDAAQAVGLPAPFHFAVDTGMSRIGFQATEEAAELCRQIAALPGLVAEGLFSHFATADSNDLSFARSQAQLFDRFDRMLQEKGVAVSIRHLDNSAGIMNFDCHYDMVRAGIITYGMYPSEQVDPARLPLTPALSWHSQVVHVKQLEAGRSIGYGATYVTQAPTTVATIPVGYADGYRRSLSGNFHVLIHGEKAPILGRICMDQLMVDVTHIPHVAVGDPVVLIGKDGADAITVEQIAEAAGSFNYEFSCGISRRVPRLYRQQGRIVQEFHYLLDK